MKTVLSESLLWGLAIMAILSSIISPSYAVLGVTLILGPILGMFIYAFHASWSH
jgi:hypothetical protein